MPAKITFSETSADRGYFGCYHCEAGQPTIPPEMWDGVTGSDNEKRKPDYWEGW